MIPVVCIAAAAWIVLACGLGRGIGSMIRRADEAMDDGVNWLPFLPAVPPSTRTVTADDYDADLPAWLFDSPSQPLTQDEFDLSEDILRGVA